MYLVPNNANKVYYSKEWYVSINNDITYKPQPFENNE